MPKTVRYFWRIVSTTMCAIVFIYFIYLGFMSAAFACGFLSQQPVDDWGLIAFAFFTASLAMVSIILEDLETWALGRISRRMTEAAP